MAKNSGNIREKNLKPFKKGQSGNPNGRPKGQRNYKTIYREALIKLAELNDIDPDSLETEMLMNAIKKARAGDIAFFRDTMDRLHGKAEQQINADIDGEIKITWM